MLHVKEQPLARQRIFVQKPISYTTLKFEINNFTLQTPRFFTPFPVSARPKSLLQFDSENHENVWTDL